MPNGRDNLAENLSDLIELIRVRRQTGLLSVEHFQGGQFEEGEINFQGGQPVYARTGQKWGEEALSELMTWHRVYFVFSYEEARPAGRTALTPYSGNRLPNEQIPTTYVPTTPQLPPQWRDEELAFAQNPGQNTSPQGLYLERLVPQKLGGERDVLSLPLTRPQRSIYLLVDGRRTISDLSRCTRKSVQEIERLLVELQDRGLISV